MPFPNFARDNSSRKKSCPSYFFLARETFPFLIPANDPYYFPGSFFAQIGFDFSISAREKERTKEEGNVGKKDERNGGEKLDILFGDRLKGSLFE